MERMYVICFYWEGDRWTSDLSKRKNIGYNNEILRKLGKVSIDLASLYVRNLYRGVCRNATRDFDFICFTNDSLEVDPEIELRKFPMHTNYGVLPRLWMFSQDAGLNGRQVLCLDLDVVIVGKLEHLMGYDGAFCARSKFQPGQEGKLDGDIMSFRAGKWIEEKVWDPFIADVDAAVDRTQGRERYWMRYTMGDLSDRWQIIAPKTVLSYKRHVMRGGIPKGAEVVSCHGFPRPHQIRDHVLRKYWWGEK
jgi:hypothetical protein